MKGVVKVALIIPSVRWGVAGVWWGLCKGWVRMERNEGEWRMTIEGMEAPEEGVCVCVSSLPCPSPCPCP